ncbi:glycosyltransferase family 2 protein [Candidatus Woesearchaeota archaeon]|nr:glycosyltransferase family 2 protein [Candidatus Woesearchaeota archaeon]
MTPNLSIIIPAYNEEERIPKTLNSYLDYLKGKINFEILVIINGCTDNTLEVVKKIAQKNKEIKYVDIGKVASKGIAVTEGFKLADSELIGFVDADLATPPNAFYDLVKNIENYDAVIASRWMKNSKINKSQPLTRIIAGRSFNILVNLLFNLKLKDTQCGAKLFKKTALKDILADIGKTRWAFDVDVLYLLKRKNYKTKEIPTEWSEPGGSHVKIKTVIEMFLSIVRLRLIYSPFKFIVSIYNGIKNAI